jgi:hypothetical protein
MQPTGVRPPVTPAAGGLPGASRVAPRRAERRRLRQNTVPHRPAVLRPLSSRPGGGAPAARPWGGAVRPVPPADRLSWRGGVSALLHSRLSPAGRPSARAGSRPSGPRRARSTGRPGSTNTSSRRPAPSRASSPGLRTSSGGASRASGRRRSGSGRRVRGGSGSERPHAGRRGCSGSGRRSAGRRPKPGRAPRGEPPSPTPRWSWSWFAPWWWARWAGDRLPKVCRAERRGQRLQPFHREPGRFADSGGNKTKAPARASGVIRVREGRGHARVSSWLARPGGSVPS